MVKFNYQNFPDKEVVSLKKLFNMNTLYIAAAIIAVSAFLLPRVIEAVNLHIDGISHIAEQVDDYYKITEPVEGEFTVELNLNDLESNEGKILFDDGESQVSVLEVLPREAAGYEVVFRSKAAEVNNGAALISGVGHVRTGSGLSQSLLAEAEADFGEGDTASLTPSLWSGLVYHDGDRFGFYLDAPVGDADQVEVTVTSLQLNLWMEKAVFR